MRRIQEQPHQHTRQSPRDRNGHNPRQQKQTHTLKVHRLQRPIAQPNTDRRASDTHTRRDRQRELRKDQHRDRRSHLHGAPSTRRMVCDLVAHDLHDVIPIRDQAHRNREGEHSDLPERHRRLGFGDIAGLPGRVDDSPGSDRVAYVVGTVGEGCSAGRQDLDKGVGVFDFIGVFLCVGVHALHASAFGSAGDAGLGGVDVVVDTVEEAGNDHGGEALEDGPDVVELVELAGAHGVIAEGAHRPAHGTVAFDKFSVKPLLSLGHEFFMV